jgi:hypothetical protein
MSTCSDKECRYLIDTYCEQNEVWDIRSHCKKHNKLIPDETPCEDYTKSYSCYNCQFANAKVYETGTIDCIDYHCNLQNDKLIFSDLNWAINNFGNFPECPIDKWKSIQK